MKQFLYLDTDIVNSILAQEEQGLVQSISNEQTSSESESDEVKTSMDVSGKVGGALLTIVKAEGTLSSHLESTDNGMYNSASKEIILKTLHDAAFDLAYKHMKAVVVKSGDENYCETGSYIELVRVFDFIDYNYLDSMFSENGIIDFIKKSSATQIEETAEASKEGYNRQDLRRAGVNFKAEVKKAINMSNKQYDDIGAIIKVIRGLIPYNRMLLSHDGYLIPLDNSYFRVNPANLGFKYGGEITCVGMITNIIGEDTNPNDDRNLFATIQFTANEVLRSLLPTKSQNLSVIHPIALFYGK